MLGPDTVELIFREPVLDDEGQPVIDGDGRPTFSERTVTKDGAKFTIVSRLPSEARRIPPVIVETAKSALPVDADALALTSKDAIRHDGALYELSDDARLKKTLIDGREHHVRVSGLRELPSAEIAELVTIRPRGGQDDDGRKLADGEPFEVLALAVDPGNTVERYGVEGTTEEADFTVVLPLGTGIRDDDWLEVRGKTGVARVKRQFSEHAERNQDVVLVRSRTGGN